jgi:hypothetical protein
MALDQFHTLNTIYNNLCGKNTEYQQVMVPSVFTNSEIHVLIVLVSMSSDFSALVVCGLPNRERVCH